MSIGVSPCFNQRRSWERAIWVGSFGLVLEGNFKHSEEVINPILIGQPNWENLSQNSLKCWRARISVGAIYATWPPAFIVSQLAATATAVLPEPTSPSRSRAIGEELFRFLMMSARALF